MTPTTFFIDGTFQNISSLFFLGTLNLKQIGPASLLSFPLIMKKPFRKNIMDDWVFFSEVECIGNIQIIHMEESEKRHRVIRLVWQGKIG